LSRWGGFEAKFESEQNTNERAQTQASTSEQPQPRCIGAVSGKNSARTLFDSSWFQL